MRYPRPEARERLYATMRRLRGTLDWYCLDHWSDALELDIVALHRNLDHRIDFLPGAREFLQQIAKRDIRLLLVTNSHTATLNIKDAVTGIAGYFDEVYTSHSLGHAKEDQSFWRELAGRERFDPSKTMFVDDNVRGSAKCADVWPGKTGRCYVAGYDRSGKGRFHLRTVSEGVADLLVNERR